MLLGANRSNLPAIRAARNAGFVTFVADPHTDSPGLREADVPIQMDVRNCDGILAALWEKGGVDGIVSMSEVGIRAAAQMSHQLGLPSISETAAANATSKSAMRRLWASTGFSTEFVVVESEQEAWRAADQLGFPLIFKPDRSFGGSRGVSRIDTPEQAGKAFLFASDAGLPNTTVVVERCITGTEHSCEVLVDEDSASVLCIGQKVKSPAPYRVDMSVQYPAPLSNQQEEAISRMCQAAVSALGLTRGVAHIEFAQTPSGPVLFELAARCGGGHTPLIAQAVTGIDEFIAACRIACGESPGQFQPTTRGGAEYRFLIFPPGHVRSFLIPEEVRRHPEVIDVEVIVDAGQDLRAVRTTGDRAGFVVTRGRTRQDAIARADWACERIVVEYADGSSSCALPLRLFDAVNL